jgi:hypothetical protein
MEVTPEQVFSLASAVALIPIIVAHLKPALRSVWPDSGPWELIADVIGVVWVVGIWQAGFAPDWIANWFAAILAGVVVGVASSQARNVVQSVVRSNTVTQAESFDERDLLVETREHQRSERLRVEREAEL